LKKAVADAPLIRCKDDDKLYPAAKVYDPRIALIRDVLGPKAKTPDPVYYVNEWEDWLDYFRMLGMGDKPLAEDLLAHIDRLRSEVKDVCSESVSEQLLRVFDHVTTHWGDLKDRLVGSAPAMTFQEALKSRPWLPVARDPDDLRRFPGARVPPAPLYTPSQVYFARRAHLVASQTPIFRPTREPEPEVREALGFRSRVPLLVVIAHFDKLRELWQQRDHAGLDAKALAVSLGEIYRYLSDFAVPGSGGTAKEGGKQDGTEIRKRYVNSQCLWHEGRFWLPKHAFCAPVPFFQPTLRAFIPVQSRERDAYELLGIRQEPDLTDFKDYLAELAGLFKGEPLPPGELPSLLTIYRRIAQLIPSAGTQDRTLTVLTQDGRLVTADHAFRADAPWVESRLDPANRRLLLHQAIPPEVADYADVPSLADRAKECPGTGALEQVDEGDTCQRCLRWQTTINSEFFGTALVRLVRHEGKKESPDTADTFRKAILVPAKNIVTDLFLSVDDQEVKVGGGGSIGYYCPTGDNHIYLNAGDYLDADDSSLLLDHLAMAINSKLRGLALNNSLPLMRIIDCAPFAIHPTLDKWRIKALPTGGTISADTNTDREEQTPIEFPCADEAEEPQADNKRKDASPGETTATDRPEGRKTDVDQTEQGKAREDTNAGDAKEPIPSGKDAPRATTSPKADKGPHVPAIPGAGDTGTRAGDGERKDTESLAVHQTAEHRTRAPRQAPNWLRVLARTGKEAESRERRERSSPDDVEARKVVVQYENDHRREAAEAAPNQEGYDVTSDDAARRVKRLIEVKGVRGIWQGDATVAMTGPQFDAARAEFLPGVEYWLYVVDRIGTSDERVYPLRWAAARVDRFYFFAQDWVPEVEKEAILPLNEEALRADGILIYELQDLLTEDPESRFAVRYRRENMHDVVQPGGVLLFRRLREDDPMPDIGSIVLIQHSGLPDFPDGIKGIAAGEFHRSPRCTPDGQIQYTEVTLRARPSMPDWGPVRLKIEPDEWFNFLPYAVLELPEREGPQHHGTPDSHDGH
jgi:hypothetical protein